MKFSLIVATLGRRDELAELFLSLSLQTHKAFEVVLVDQNPEGYLDDVVESYADALSIRRVFSMPGLSRARNMGLALAEGDALAFPDDDCVYAPDTLNTAAQALKHADVAIASQLDLEQLTHGDAVSSEGWRAALFTPPNRAGLQQRATNLFQNAASITLFFTSEIVSRTGEFDERIGAGAGTRWGSGEDTDFLLKAFGAGAKIMRAPEIRVYHPKLLHDSSQDSSKAMAYGRGRMFVLRKHKMPLWFVMANLLFPFVKATTLVTDMPLCRFYFYLGVGRMEEALREVGTFLKRCCKRVMLFVVKSLGAHRGLCGFVLKKSMRLHNLCYALISLLAPMYEANKLHPKHRIIRYHDWFLQQLCGGAAVLDIGCGNGTLASAMAEKAGFVTGIDIVPANIEQAKARYQLENVEFLCADATEFIPERKYDYIVLSNVLEHIDERSSFLRKLYTQMQDPYPILLVRVPLIDRCWLPKYKRELGVEWRLDSTHFTEYTLDELKQEIREAGLEMLALPEQRFGEVFVAASRAQE